MLVDSSEFGTIDDVDFTRHDCRFAGEADSLEYTRADLSTGSVAFDVRCSIVLPTDPAEWNGKVMVEPLDQFSVGLPTDSAEFARSVLLTDESLFAARSGGRWGYAVVSYFGGDIGDVVDQPPPTGGIPAASVEILSDFAVTLKAQSSALFSKPADGVAGIGLSNAGAILRSVMAMSHIFGAEPFDATLVIAAGDLRHLIDPTNTEAFIAPLGPADFGHQRALFLDSEGEVIANGTYDLFGFFPVAPADVAGESDDVYRFRYEIAGGSHLDRTVQDDNEALGLFPPGTFADSNQLAWTSLVRGLFGRIDLWLAEGTPPPPSRLLEPATTPGLPDPAYPGHPSVVEQLVERDGNLNALGGVRLPDVELGVGTYRAIGPPLDFSGDPATQFFQWLAGGFTDLSCTPTGAGSMRFQNHGDYVSQHRAITRSLVEDGLIEQRDAAAMTAAAARSDIGKCDT